MIATLVERLLGLTGLSKTLIAIGAAVAIAAGAAAAYGVWHHKVYQSGYDRALLDIARADAAAIDRATVKRNDWRACRDAGRKWDQTAGRCQ